MSRGQIHYLEKSMRNIVNDEKYINQRKELEQYLNHKYLLQDHTEILLSPTGKYSLALEYYQHIEGMRRYSVTKGILLNEKKEKISEIKRNYSSFPHCWVGLGNKDKYLLFGQDYQGYSIIDLKAGEMLDYVPESAYEGDGFCWAAIDYQEGSNIITVKGCYWAYPYEIVFYDFSKPMELPYKELLRISDYEEVIGWTGKRQFEYISSKDKKVKRIVL